MEDELQSEFSTSLRKKYNIIIYIFLLISCIFVGSFLFHKINSRPKVIPIIYADSTPYKIKPEDPGGMKVANLDKTIYEAFDDSKPLKIERILPKPEEPILLKSISEESVDTDEISTSNSSIVQEKLPQTITSLIQNQGTIKKTLLSEEIKEAKSNYEQQKQEKSSYKIQLGTYPSKETAEKNWIILKKKFPKQLDKLMLLINIKKAEGKLRLYNLQAGYITSQNNARAICKFLSSKGQSCFLAQKNGT